MDMNLETLAATLEASGDYRVLRRIKRRDVTPPTKRLTARERFSERAL